MASPDDDCEQVRKIFVGGLNRITDDDALSKFFLPWGVIVDHTVMRDNQNISRGFGFVTFETSEPVDNLMKAKREGQKFRLDETEVEIKRAFPKSSGSYPGEKLRDAVNRTRKLFVGGIPSSTTDNDLRQYFGKYGAVNEVEILYDKVTQRMRGFAFVTFDDEDAADKACQVREHKIKMKTCEVKKAESRSTIKQRQGPPGNAGPRGGFQGYNQGAGNMGMGNGGNFGQAAAGGGDSYSSIAALQALGLTGSILQNLLSSGAINQAQLQNAIGGLQGGRQGGFASQPANYGAANFANPIPAAQPAPAANAAAGNNPLALLGMLGNMGGQLGNLLNLAGLATLASGAGNVASQSSTLGSTSDTADQYRQGSYGAATSQSSSNNYTSGNTNATQDNSYGYGYNYNMGSYSPQQSGYGPIKYQSPGGGSTTDKKNFRPY